MCRQNYQNVEPQIFWHDIQILLIWVQSFVFAYEYTPEQKNKLASLPKETFTSTTEVELKSKSLA